MFNEGNTKCNSLVQVICIFLQKESLHCKSVDPSTIYLAASFTQKMPRSPDSIHDIIILLDTDRSSLFCVAKGGKGILWVLHVTRRRELDRTKVFIISKNFILQQPARSFIYPRLKTSFNFWNFSCRLIWSNILIFRVKG